MQYISMVDHFFHMLQISKRSIAFNVGSKLVSFIAQEEQRGRDHHFRHPPSPPNLVYGYQAYILPYHIYRCPKFLYLSQSMLISLSYKNITHQNLFILRFPNSLPSPLIFFDPFPCTQRSTAVVMQQMSFAIPGIRHCQLKRNGKFQYEVCGHHNI